jgi:hypothetical protein
MARLIETDTLANQDINAAVAIGAYTGATIPRMVVVRVLVNQVAGGGDYIVYATLTKSAVEYRVIPTTTGTAAAALTSIAFTSIPIPVDVGDVLTVYIDGLAADTVTPDTRVDFYESGHLMPTTTDLTLDVAATGEAGLDFDNVKLATAPTTLTNITVPVVSAISGTLGTFDALWLKVKAWLRLGFRKDAAIATDHAVELGEINANMGTGAGAFLSTSDSQEAIRDAIPAAAPAMITLQEVRDAMKLDATAGAPAGGSVDAHLDTAVGFGAPPAMITKQNVRDAMKLDAGVGAPAAGSVDAHLDTVVGDTATLLARIGAFLGTTVNTLYGWLRSLMRKDVAAPSDVGGTFDPATDSTEGLRDTLPTPPAMITQQNVRDAMKLAPTGGALAAGSVDKHLDDLLAATPPDVNAIADQVWNEALAGHLGVGSTGAALNGASAPTAGAVADAVWDETLALHLLPGSTGAKLNAVGGVTFPAGAIEYTYTVTDSFTLLPIEGVEVWVSTDLAGVNIVWAGVTNAFGVAQDVLGALAWLDPGTYYFWRQKTGYAFVNPDVEVV